MQIYLDHSATTPPHPAVVAWMRQIDQEQWGNASSLHQWGDRAALVLETARAQVAGLLNAPDPTTIIFTSGGTEADNLALLGITRHYAKPQHLIISSVEHPAIAATADWLATRGWRITRLPVDIQGQVSPAALAAALRPDTVLVSVIYAQSEVGTLQPIAPLAEIAQAHGVLFHTDAVQAVGRCPLDVQALGVDLLSLSGHKFYGPQGIGALYVRPGVELVPLLWGGGQERGWRSGTQAIPLVGGLGQAAQLAAEQLATESRRLQTLRDRLFAQLLDDPRLAATGDRQARLPHHVSLCLPEAAPGITGRTLVRQLKLAGIASSAGSACHSGQASPSPVLQAMGYDAAIARTGLRLSLGRTTTREDIDWTALVLRQILDRLWAEHAPAKRLTLSSNLA
ncbi:MAG: cysteine desulfurase family protein [Cyanobacteria bacterium P01_G01_bin.54]